MNYQGHLTDTSDLDMADGPYTVLFTLYDAPTAGTALWSEVQSITLKRGLFNVLLGSVSSLSSLGASGLANDLWLGVKVGADAEMTPRQQLVAVPYARNAQTLGGLKADNSANNIVVLDGTGKVPAGLVQSSSFSLPLDFQGVSSSYALNVSNTSNSSSAQGLLVSGPQAIQAQATDSLGTALLAQTAPTDSAGAAALRASATNGQGLVAFSTNAQGISVSTQSSSRASLVSQGAFPMRLTASSSVAGNAGLQAFTQDSSSYAALVDRGNKAGVFAQGLGTGAYGVSATSASAVGIYGQSNSPNSGPTGSTDAGVLGIYTGSHSSGGISVLGVNSLGNGTGVVGRHLGAGSGQGVRGSSLGAGGTGVYGTVTGSASTGVQGYANNNDGYGVMGYNIGSSPVATSAGVFGRSFSQNVGTGVRGEGGQGVYGLSQSICGVCAFNTGGGTALQAGSSGVAVQAESTATTGVTYAVNASIQTVADGAAAGRFQAQGASGATYGVYAFNDSPNGYGVYASGGQEAVHALANSGGISVYSDTNSNPAYGFYHGFAGTGPANGVGVYSNENCPSCFSGVFVNTQANSTDDGAALSVEGRIKLKYTAGTFGVTASVGSPAPSYPFGNSYLRANSLLFITAATATSSVAAVTGKADGTFTLTFTPPLTANTSYQYLIIGQ